jgi:hypothetical protein
VPLISRRATRRSASSSNTLAISEYSEVDQESPDYASALYKRALAELKSGQESQARTDYESVKKLKPELLSGNEFPDFYYTRAIQRANSSQASIRQVT